MKLQRLQLFISAFSTTISLCFATNFTGKLDFPFSKITVNDENFNTSVFNFTCKEKFANTKECAEQCYYREKYGAGCIAFLKFKNTKECRICNPATIAEIKNSTNTQINESDAVYILKYKKKKSVMYLPLDGDNTSGATVIGHGVNGTLHKVENTIIQVGKVNQGLHVSNGGRGFLDNTANVCINRLDLCSNGLSIALWLNPSNLGDNFRHITHGRRSINIAISNRRIASWAIIQRMHQIERVFLAQTKRIPSIESKSSVFTDTWIHVAVVYDPDVGLSLYINGVLEAFRSIDEEVPDTNQYGPHDYMFGAKENGGFDFDGTLDEIKVFYETLTKTGMFTDNVSNTSKVNIINCSVRLLTCRTVFHLGPWVHLTYPSFLGG